MAINDVINMIWSIVDGSRSLNERVENDEQLAVVLNSYNVEKRVGALRSSLAEETIRKQNRAKKSKANIASLAGGLYGGTAVNAAYDMDMAAELEALNERYRGYLEYDANARRAEEAKLEKKRNREETAYDGINSFMSIFK